MKRYEDKILLFCLILFVAYIIALLLMGCGTVEVVGDVDCGDDAEPVVVLEMQCKKNPEGRTPSG